MCFSLYWLFSLVAWLAGICVLVAVFKILIPWALEMAGAVVDARIWRILNLILGLIIFLIVLWLVYDLVQCALVGNYRVLR